MRLIGLVAENVFSLGHVSLDLSNRKLLLVTGFSNDDKSGNGAGKSSLANHAIVWGLFGQTYDGTKGDAVVNRHSDKKFGKVEIEFLDINGIPCRVVRTRNPNGLKLYSMIPSGVVVDSGRPSSADTQEMINKRLGRDFSTFIHSDLIGPGTERSFFRLSGAEQVSVLENLLPINSLEEWTGVAKARAKYTQARIVELNAKRNQIVGKQTALQDYSKNIDRQYRQWDANRKSEIAELQMKIAMNRSKYMELVTERAALNEKAGFLDYGALKEERDRVWELRVTHQKEMEFLEELCRLATCVVCTQDVPPNLREEADRKAQALKQKVDENSRHHVALDRMIVEHERLYFLLDQINKCNEGLADLTKRHDALQKAENPHTGVEISNTIIKLSEELIAVNIELDKRLTELRWFDFWSNGYGKDLRTMMIEEVCPFLEQRINEYLVRLGNPQFKATVSTVKTLKSGDIREKFNLDIKSDHGANSFDLLSVGEKQIVSFAASLAVADLATTQVSGRSNVLILDEPFMGLHKNNCDNIINFLNSCDVETILLISNEEALKELVPNRVHIVKTKGVSWLE